MLYYNIAINSLNGNGNPPSSEYGSAYAGTRSSNRKILAAESFAFEKSGAEAAARPSCVPPKIIAEKTRKTKQTLETTENKDSRANVLVYLFHM